MKKVFELLGLISVYPLIFLFAFLATIMIALSFSFIVSVSNLLFAELWVLTFFGVIAVLSALISFRLKNKEVLTREWLGTLGEGLTTELIGAIVTGLIFIVIVHPVEDRAQDTERINDLVIELNSSIQDQTIAATEELMVRGWMYDGSLKGINIIESHLQYSVFVNADLEGSRFWITNFDYSNFSGANLSGSELRNLSFTEAILSDIDLSSATIIQTSFRYAVLTSANLSDANIRYSSFDNTILTNVNLSNAIVSGNDFTGAQLQRANLMGADLTCSDLSEANLTGADLRGANLTGAVLTDSVLNDITFDENTVMPDGETWSANTTDITRSQDEFSCYANVPSPLQPQQR